MKHLRHLVVILVLFPVIAACDMFGKGYEMTSEATKSADETQVINKTKDYILYPASLLYSGIGVIEGNDMVARVGQQQAGFLTFGPYIKLPPGEYRFVYKLSANATGAGEKVGAWDVFSPAGIADYKRGDVLSHPGQFEISEIFTVTPEDNGKDIEIRVWYDGVGNLTAHSLLIKRIR